MRLAKIVFYFLLFTSLGFIYSAISSGCAQIGAPTGGLKDTIPPHLVKATPAVNSINFTGNTITLGFDEYVTVDNVQTNLLVSPYPKTNPVVNYKLRNVTIKLKDTLKANTTYSIDFGNSIKDVNEGNVVNNFTYVFSTGNTIDSLELSGKVILAETGRVDSTILVLLYRNANDSSVAGRKPDYVGKLNGDGNFTFRNLPSDTFKIYALKDETGSKTYNSKFETFAFADSDVVISASIKPVTLYAYAEKKEEKKPASTSAAKPSKSSEKKIKHTVLLDNGRQDILHDLEIDFNKPVKKYDSQKIVLTDTLFHPISGTLTLDSTRKKIFIAVKWKKDDDYRLIIYKNAVTDSADNELPKTDTINFKAKGENDYGSLLFRVTNINISKHPVLLLLKGDEIVKSIPITTSQWNEKLFQPGEYELRILYDSNNNGKWDPGNYSKKLQPEKVISLDKKLSIKANWDNERDIQL